MSAIKRLIVFVVVAASAIAIERLWLNAIQPHISTELAINQLNGDDQAFRQLRLFETYKETANLITIGIILSAAWILLPRRRWMNRNALTRLSLIALACTFALSGCIRPYDSPEYSEIDTSETGFLIPLEGDGGVQAKFQSEEYLRQLKVAAKRVQITHRWSQEGRLLNSGHWIPMVRLIKVNAFIPEDEAAKFLYWYPSGSLAGVMDTEVRARIQQVAAEIAAKYPLDALRARKQEISDAVKSDVTSFFVQRGVVITTVGMFGGMTYENGEIQKAIDHTVIAQQLKVVNEAKFQAQQRENDRVELEANAVAERARRIAAGEADAKKIAALAEAQALREVNKALAEAGQNPLLYQLRSLEVERARVEHWNGQYPTYLLQTGSTPPNLMLQMPAATH